MRTCNIATIYRHELRLYFVSPIPYFFLFVFSAVVGFWYFWQHDALHAGRADLSAGFFGFLPWAFLILIPGITMRLWSEEASRGTTETLMTLPISTSSLVLGKFLAAWTLLAASLASTFAAPITISSLGDLDWGATIAGYVGAMCLGGAMIGLGLWVSALTRHQMVAFIGALFAIFLFMIIGVATATDVGTLGRIGQAISLESHYVSMSRGVLDFRDLLYFASVVAFFLYLNVRTLENRRHA